MDKLWFSWPTSILQLLAQCLLIFLFSSTSPSIFLFCNIGASKILCRNSVSNRKTLLKLYQCLVFLDCWWACVRCILFCSFQLSFNLYTNTLIDIVPIHNLLSAHWWRDAIWRQLSGLQILWVYLSHHFNSANCFNLHVLITDW